MKLQIVTPEAVVFDKDVNSVIVPGVEGDFQMLDNHAPIVSLLVEGNVIIDAAGVDLTNLKKTSENFIEKEGKFAYHIKGGVLEMKDNKAIVLAD